MLVTYVSKQDAPSYDAGRVVGCFCNRTTLVKHRKMPRSYNAAARRAMLSSYDGRLPRAMLLSYNAPGVARRAHRTTCTPLHDASVVRCSGPSYDACSVVRCPRPSCDVRIVRHAVSLYDDSMPLPWVDALGRCLANGGVPMPYICAAHWPIDQYDPVWAHRHQNRICCIMSITLLHDLL